MSEQTVQKITFVDTHAELVHATLPELGSDQILVRSYCSLISPGTEKAALTRMWDDAAFRESPGYSIGGDVVEVGRKVTDYAVGDRVYVGLAHADYLIAPANPVNAMKVPAGVSYEASTFTGLASVAMHAWRRARVEFGETVVIIGAGIIGQVLVQLAKMGGARRVVILDLLPSRLDLARHYGADVTINPRQADAASQVREVTGGTGPTVILEATGNPRAILEAFNMAGHGCRIVCVGVMEEPITIKFHKEFLQKELSLIASFQPFCPTTDVLYWHWTQQANRQLLLNLMAEGKLCVEEMVTDRFTPQQAPEAYERIKAGDPKMLGALIEWHGV